MLFRSRFHEGIRAGRITTTVRIWKRPHVKLGGRYRLGDGAIVVDRMFFKRDVRKLKALGLTISLEVGYRLSARGEAVLSDSAGA